jgi:hypothetical protein
METDGQILKISASILDDAADIAEPTTRDFENGTVIDTSQWGGGGIPLQWDPGKRLSDLVDGPYRDVRDRMIAAMDYAVRVMRENADAVNSTANAYMATELTNAERMQELHR